MLFVRAGQIRHNLSFAASFALLSVVAAGPAKAQISESVSIDNNYGFVFGNQPPATKTGGSKETFYEGSYSPSSQSELGINYTATADSSGFFFLHDNYCVGSCSTTSNTSIVFDVTNTGDGQESIRFDSQITPGHLAKILAGGSMSAGFTFEVLKVQFEQTQTLYSASGSVSSRGIFLDTGGLDYNGLRRQTGTTFDLLDWSTTNLSLDLGSLSGFQSMQVIYRATYWAEGSAECIDVFACPGAQVVFGDPRNNGGTNQSELGFDGPLALDGGRAVIGAEYGASFVPFAFVRSDAPPSFIEPDPGEQLSYDPLYRSRLQGAVPEPATWAMMIAGFGMVGGLARRRRRADHAIA